MVWILLLFIFGEVRRFLLINKHQDCVKYKYKMSIWFTHSHLSTFLNNQYNKVSSLNTKSTSEINILYTAYITLTVLKQLPISLIPHYPERTSAMFSKLPPSCCQSLWHLNIEHISVHNCDAILQCSNRLSVFSLDFLNKEHHITIPPLS